jgi:hypothetical protein
MNLHAVVGPVIAAVNPSLPALLSISSGSVTNADGTRTPHYQQPALSILAQVQPLSTRDIMHVEKLSLQGKNVAIYITGELDGLVRSQIKGGDLVTISTGPNAGVYLISAVLEQWPDWVKVTAVLQIDSFVRQ